MVSDVRALKLIGLGLAVAVAIDATIVRVVLVPATMELLGDANWWLPRWLQRLIPKISVEELLAMDLEDLIVERVVLENMLNAKHVRSFQIINGLKRGHLTRALNGEHVGTIIYAGNGGPP